MSKQRVKRKEPIEITIKIGAFVQTFTGDPAQRIYAAMQNTIIEELDKAGAFKECGE